MKYFLPILILMLTVWSCQSNSNTDENHDTHQEMSHEKNDMASHSDDHDHDAMHDTSLKLNDGKKWQLDAPTKKNADHIKSVTAQFQDSKATTLADFKDYGNDIQEGLNQMIRECTMTGADDEALHQWFFPIMGNTSQIAKTDDLETAKHSSHEIIERVHELDQYFE